MTDLGFHAKSAPQEHRVLIYDDDKVYAEECAEALMRLGYRTKVRTGHGTFLQAVNDFQPDILILDLHMPDEDGVESLMSLQHYSFREALSVVLISAAVPSLLDAAAKLAKAYGVNLIGICAKPLRLKELILLLASENIRTQNSTI